MNKKTLTTIFIMVVIFSFGWIAKSVFTKPKIIEKEVIKEYWKDPDFKPIIEKIDKQFAELNAKQPEVIIKPYKVTEYLNPETNLSLVYERDSLLKVVDSLGQLVVAINPKFLLAFRTSRKLVLGSFLKDTLLLTLYDINGSVKTETYPVDYSKYTYEFRDNLMGVFPVPPTKGEAIKEEKEKKLSQALYLNGGYSILTKDPLIGIDYSIYYKRLRLSSDNFLILNKSPELYFNVTLGYKMSLWQ